MTYCQQDLHEAWSKTATTIHDILSTRPAQSMVEDSNNNTWHTVNKTRTKHGRRQQQQYMTYCRQDPHEAWSKTATTIHDILSTRPARSMVEDSNNNTWHTVDETRTKHGRRQQQQYMTYCRRDPHKAWSKTATTIHDILSTRPARSMVEDSNNNTWHTVDETRTKHGRRQQQQYMTYCQQDPHKAWSKTATTIHDILSTRPAQSMVEDSNNNTWHVTTNMQTKFVPNISNSSLNVRTWLFFKECNTTGGRLCSSSLLPLHRRQRCLWSCNIILINYCKIPVSLQ